VKPTKLIRGDGESRKKLVAACRKVSCCAALAWRKRNLVRDIRTQGNCGPRQGLCAAGILVTLRARLAQRKGTFARKNKTRNHAGRRTSRQPFGKRRWRYSEGNLGRKDPGGRWPRYLMEGMTSATNGIGAWTSGQQAAVGNRGTQMEVRYELVSVDIATARMRSIKEWTLRRGSPLPKRLKKKLLAVF
jgi:hypothetical protein